MPLPYAPSLPSPVITPGLPSPIVAPGISRPVPFIRPGLPVLLPIRPPIPALLPALPVLGAPVAAPAAGGLARVAVRGAALLGAFGLGLAIGNEVYEEVLNRPFGPSLQDLFFPEGQPVPLPVPQHQYTKGRCDTQYCLHVTVVARSNSTGNINTNGAISPTGGLCGYPGPIGLPYTGIGSNGGTRVYVRDARNIEVQMFNATGQTVLSMTPDHRRMDGQPDECFAPDLEPLPDPVSLPRPTRHPSELPYFPDTLPEPEPLRVPAFPRLPGYPDIPYLPFVPDFGLPEAPEPTPPPFLIPITPPLPQTPRVPVTQPELERNQDGSLRVIAPPLPGFECCPSLETMVRELRDRTQAEECDLTEVERLLQEILDKLCVEGFGTLDLTDCDGLVPVTASYEGMGIAGLFSAVDAISASLNVIHGDTKCPPEDCVAAVPDWWQMRPGADRPQLSVIFRKGDGKNYHAINIPHPITNPQPTVTPIGPYMAGNFQAIIVCIDNSKFIVNANSRLEAERVALEASQAIRPVMLGSPIKISITERRGYPVSIDIMTPRYMQFFPEGQKSRRPEWKKTFN